MKKLALSLVPALLFAIGSIVTPPALADIPLGTAVCSTVRIVGGQFARNRDGTWSALVRAVVTQDLDGGVAIEKESACTSATFAGLAAACQTAWRNEHCP